MSTTGESSPITLAGMPVAGIQRVLAGVVIALFLLSSVGRILKFAVYWDFAYTFVESFWLDAEFGVPRFFATGLLFIVALAAGANGLVALRRNDAHWKQWAVASVAFALAGVEKIAGLHDRYGAMVYRFVEDNAIGRAAALLSVAVGLGIAAWLARFVAGLPIPVRRRIAAACAIFAVASIGLEWLGSEVTDVHDTSAIIRYFVCASLEEILEMIGTLVFLNAFLFVLMGYVNASPSHVNGGGAP